MLIEIWHLLFKPHFAHFYTWSKICQVHIKRVTNYAIQTGREREMMMIFCKYLTLSTYKTLEDRVPCHTCLISHNGLALSWVGTCRLDGWSLFSVHRPLTAIGPPSPQRLLLCYFQLGRAHHSLSYLGWDYVEMGCKTVLALSLPFLLRFLFDFAHREGKMVDCKHEQLVLETMLSVAFI